ncbi:MAG: septum formation initiator family protein [Deltaproteobacteria bacterium]|jgi:cell division protein FtsB|nr:septum formation initiator family protein [Deltaproteobacteria bacterium]MBW2503377.1 septum formation initiator family protein [Deltaproteobacteria bacterium]MBW2519974.1 septum formation initiator family protein [Deltaproteobacteria bacterium]
MAEVKAQKTLAAQRHLNLLPLGLVLVLLGFAFFGDRGVLFLLKIAQQKAALIAELEEVNSLNNSLNSEIRALRNDRHYIERLARTELGMVRDDELVFQFPTENTARR